MRQTLAPNEPIPSGDDRWTEEKVFALEERIRLMDEARSPKGKTCQFPCSCWNPNDCSHDDDCTGCDQPAVIRFDKMFMCQKHHDYHHACLYR